MEDSKVHEEEAVKEEQPPQEKPPDSPKPLAPAKQRAPRKTTRVKKVQIEAQPPTPQENPVSPNPRFFVELSGTLKDMMQQERRHRLSTLKIV